MNEALDISINGQQDFSIEHIMRKLGYNDIRSVLKWCKKNGVIVFAQGKKRLVNATQFLVSFYKPLINQLKEQYPDKWGELFRSFIKQDFEKAMETLNPKKFVRSTQRYKPKSEGGKSFLSNSD
ncbi:hypothetical protein [Parvicella tangerina]|uniref:Uncharacterized protein n=1 Tax=Parvicella tangerina TaxID=2829795 RepID=A0A916NEI1_9FLAO|nr:hypothetical protein [Parvicella tangerina]CAG5086748.1 hypothetical protein CRYO30217_03264 [Parvicella tangerina]